MFPGETSYDSHKIKKFSCVASFYTISAFKLLFHLICSLELLVHIFFQDQALILRICTHCAGCEKLWCSWTCRNGLKVGFYWTIIGCNDPCCLLVAGVLDHFWVQCWSDRILLQGFACEWRKSFRMKYMGSFESPVASPGAWVGMDFALVVIYLTGCCIWVKEYLINCILRVRCFGLWLWLFYS